MQDFVRLDSLFLETMGNKGGYILGTSLAKDKTQIISDLLLFMDFVWVAIRVGEAPNFLSCHRLVNVG